MESEQSQNFNERLSQWVASQGFWFQIRYSMVGSGTKGTMMFHLLRLGFRVLVFLLVVAVGVGFYLVRRTGMQGFNDGFKSELKAKLNASEIELLGVSRVQGQLGISGLACKGENGTFFSSIEARNIYCKMGFLDGLAGKWNPGTVRISRLDMNLRAGSDDDESSRMLADSLFKNFGNVELKSFEVADATVRWGYSKSITPGDMSLSNSNGAVLPGYETEHTRGSITNSFLRIQRSEDELRFTFKGGKFSQNWFQKLDIVNLEVVCNRDGMLFEKAEFRRLQGTVDFSGLRVTGGARPRIQGEAKVRSMALSSILPPPVRSFVEGSLSGDFNISGSTNSSEGISFDGGVTLDSQDVISVRERLHLLKALSVVDYTRTYHRIDFREGSFHLKSSGGGVDLTDVSLTSDEQIKLEGRLRVRLPTVEETRSAVQGGSGAGGSPIFDQDDVDADVLESKSDVDFTLRRAAAETKRARDGGQPDGSASLFDRLELGLEKRRIEEQVAERLSRTLRYEGLFKISIPPDAFERAPKLASQYPVDPGTGRIPLMVPIEGNLYEITFKQAEDIYQQGRR